MNLFRILGDLLHLLSVLIILEKIRRTKNCVGISLKSQELYLIVFATRYLDLLNLSHNFESGLSTYNTIMKCLFLASSAYIVYLMRLKFKATYDKEHDSFRIEFLLIPCLLLGFIWNEKFTFLEVLWAFSIYLEAVAILPQLLLLSRTGSVEGLTADYIFSLGLYRAFYLLNWIYRYFTEDDYTQWIVWVSGITQTAIYADFFYIYIKSAWYGSKEVRLDQLPM